MHAGWTGKSLPWLICIGRKQAIFLGKCAQDALIMNIDDLLCVGATDNILLSSIGRNKTHSWQRFSGIINGTEELIKELDTFDSIHSTGGETADVGDLFEL
jgi:phosphoribosylformylglycinamidine cyclo-ligase